MGVGVEVGAGVGLGVGAGVGVGDGLGVGLGVGLRFFAWPGGAFAAATVTVLSLAGALACVAARAVAGLVVLGPPTFDVECGEALRVLAPSIMVRVICPGGVGPTVALGSGAAAALAAAASGNRAALSAANIRVFIGRPSMVDAGIEAGGVAGGSMTAARRRPSPVGPRRDDLSGCSGECPRRTSDRVRPPRPRFVETPPWASAPGPRPGRPTIASVIES